MSEAEILALLGTGDDPLPRIHWSPLYLAAEMSLVSRSGLIGFFHDYFREAVRKLCLPTEADCCKAHLRLARYFQNIELSPRQVDELPWQLAEAKAWERLYALLADLAFFAAAWEANEFEVKANWVLIEEHSSFRMMDAYRPVLDAPEPEMAPIAGRLASLLAYIGHLDEALSLRSWQVKHYRATSNQTELGECLSAQALILRARGDLDGAMALLKEQERICRELGNDESLSRSLGNQALILHARGDWAGAMALLKEVERICRELGNKDGLQKTLGNRGIFLREQGDLDGAMALLKEQERICRELGNKDSLSNSLGSQGPILRVQGNLDGAMALLKEQERICRELGNKNGVSISLARLSQLGAISGEIGCAHGGNSCVLIAGGAQGLVV